MGGTPLSLVTLSENPVILSVYDVFVMVASMQELPREIFTEAAIDEVSKFSGGIPHLNPNFSNLSNM